MRLRLFPPQALLARLSSRLRLLTGGARNLPTRLQTLRGTIDWSYRLLSEQEQSLFTGLSIFAGGCTVEAADEVCNPDGDLDVLEGITSLVEKSLVRQEGDQEAKFTMLETIREYAQEKLAERGELEDTHERHAWYFWEESLSLFRELEDVAMVALVLSNLGQTAYQQGEFERAKALLMESIPPAQRAGYHAVFIWFLFMMAAMVVDEGEAALAARLLGTEEALRTATGRALEPGDEVVRQRTVETGRAQLGEVEWNRAWEEGRAMAPEEAIALARAYAADQQTKT